MSLADRLQKIRTEIGNACKRSQRSVSEVHLLAVSKLQPVELIEEAYALGLRDFGENYVQELKEKKEQLSHLSEIRWHLIGPLQSNKAKLALQSADVFQALDSLKLAQKLASAAKALGRQRPWSVFVQVNVDEEETKSGVNPNDLAPLVEGIKNLPALKLTGLMCIPRPRENLEVMRDPFKKLRSLSEQFPELGLQLSMGMSEDFQIAIEEGANWIRVGRSLFGARR